MPDGSTQIIDRETGEVLDFEPRNRLDRPMPSPAPMPPEIAKAVVSVMAGVTGGVEKSGENKFHNYKYATAAAALILIQPLMVGAGLIVTQHALGADKDDGGNMVVRFLFVLHAGGMSWTYPGIWLGVANDRAKGGALQDKWFNKAATAAEKYFLLKLFKVPTVDEADPDADRGSAEEHEERRPPRQTRQARGNGRREESGLEPAVAEARRLYKEIDAALDACESEAECGRLWAERDADLTKIKEASQEGYDKLAAKLDAKVTSFGSAN